jgi:TonB family protein
MKSGLVFLGVMVVSAAQAQAPGHLVTARRLMSARDFDSARTVLREVAAVGTRAVERAEAWVLLGIVEHFSGSDSLAREAFRAAITIDSTLTIAGFRDFAPEAARLFDEERCEISGVWDGERCNPVKIVFVDAFDVPPKLLHGPKVHYPWIYADQRIGGRVMVQAMIDRDGRADPATIKIVRSLRPAFDSSAVTFVRAAVFRPAELEGRPVRAWVSIPIDFAAPKREAIPDSLWQRPPARRFPY